MRILFINSIRMFGGGEVWMLRTLNALRERGHQVWLCCRPQTELAKRALDQGFRVKHVRFHSDFDPIHILQLAMFMQRNCIEVVLTNMDKELRVGGMAAKLAGVAAVLPRRGIDYPLKNRWHYRFAYNVLATRIIANSQATKEALLKNSPWLKPERIEVIHNGIELKKKEVASERQYRHKLGVADEVPLNGFVGQLDERKGISILLTAFGYILERVPDARLVIAGKGPLLSMIEGQIKKNNWQDHVILTGFIDDVFPLMKAIDLLLLPSLWEGFGIVLIEAMAAGRPVITTNVSSMPEIVEHGKTGYLVEPGNAQELADRTIELLLNHKRRNQFGQAALLEVERKFSFEKMILKLENLFEQEIARRH